MSVDDSPLFSIQWALGATTGNPVQSSFLIGTSLCDDSAYHGCVSNDDTTLDFQASVSPEPQAAPEPSTAALLAAGLAMIYRSKRRP